jgi:UDP-N-acetylglucosamine 4,6-dehydratase/5-epimerase
VVKHFISGVTGTLGRAVCEKLLMDPGIEVVGYSRDELKQSQIPKHPRLTLYLGDVRNRSRLVEATRGVSVLFHFAALKRVDSMEENPEECVFTNVDGTMNILGAQRANKIRRVVLASTDKAAHPETVYGACKFLSERLVLRNQYNVVCRYGNVLASRGSVVHSFVKSLLDNREINITHKEMTRFFLSIDQAASFVVNSARDLDGGLKIPKLKACKVLDLANVTAKLLGIDQPKINVVGVRGIEKIHECLRTPCEGQLEYSDTAPKFTQEELIHLVKPVVDSIAKARPKNSLRLVNEVQA